MRIIARSTLKRFVQSRSRRRGHEALKAAPDAWFDEVRRAKSANMAAVKRLYGAAGMVSADRIAFNIKGNDYRLVTAIDFEKQIVWVEWIGSHAEYDRIDVRAMA